jgi:hypothetical protein
MKNQENKKIITMIVSLEEAVMAALNRTAIQWM